MRSDPGHLARLVEAATDESGDDRAVEELHREVYQQLRGVAGNLMRNQSQGHTLRPTELVHEAYLKLVGGANPSWQGRAHFLNAAAQAMRHILVDHARRKASQKRGGGLKRVTLSHAATIGIAPELDVLALNDALDKLERNSSRMAKVAELRAFAGMSAHETGYVLGVSKRTVERDFRLARLWLQREIEGWSPA